MAGLGRRGMARLGMARHGSAGHGRQGSARRGKAWLGRAGQAGQEGGGEGKRERGRPFVLYFIFRFIPQRFNPFT